MKIAIPTIKSVIRKLENSQLNLDLQTPHFLALYTFSFCNHKCQKL